MVMVQYSEHFSFIMENLSEKEQELLGSLTLYIEANGFEGLPGRNKSSNDFPRSFLGKKRMIEEDFVLKNKLWHYHVGYLCYRTINKRGDWTSDFVVHYQNLSEEEIRFVHYSSHKPVFRNPLPSYLT